MSAPPALNDKGECAGRCAYGICGAMAGPYGCGGCCACLGGCQVQWENQQPAPALSPSELATVARFDAAPDPFCDCCDGAGQVCAVPVGAAEGALIPCPLCAGTGEAA